MKKKVLIYFIIIMVACTIIGRAASGMSIPRVAVEKPKTDYITHTVRSTGVVEKNAEEGIYTIPGMIAKKIHVNIGDAVEEGDILLELSLETLEEQLIGKQNELRKIELQKADEASQNQVNAENRARTIRQARDNYNQTVNQANHQIGQAQQEFEEAKGNLENAGEAGQKEWNAPEKDDIEETDGTEKADTSQEGKVSKEERDALEADVAAKDNALQQAESARDEALLRAQQALEQAEAREATRSTIESLQIDEEVIKKEIEKLEVLKENQGIVRAGVDGVVTNLFIGTGEQTGNTAIMLLADTSRGYRFVVDVTKEENKYLAIGQEVSLSSTGSKRGAIEKLKIESIIATENDAETMRVTVPVSAEQFYIGESAEMLAVHGARQYPVCVPISALIEEDKEYFVYLFETEKTILGEVTIVRKHKVNVLDKNETHVAIDNLTSEQMVVTDANKALQDGIRVRKDES